MSGKSRLPRSSIVFFTVATGIFLIAIAALVNNIILFKDNVARYIEQGYPSAEVVKQLIPNQLLPGIFEPLAVYCGIAVILFSAGLINNKISKIVTASVESEAAAENSSMEITEKTESVAAEALEDNSQIL
jgi:hypothetical protein